jgi:protein-S-isoprenylcysteine O-methyltransferase Ste14
MFVKFVNNIYSIATGNKRKRRILAPIAALFFAAVTLAFVIFPLYLDNTLHIPQLVFNPWNVVISVLFLAAGLSLMLWSLTIFSRSKGTPVPLDPPPVLITHGPFRYSRNPMTAGLFMTMFGAGVYFGSITSLLIFTPLYIMIHYIHLKHVEEPELEKRLGKNYLEYKKGVPMFFPWKRNLKS